MSRKVFISFLGTGKYSDCTYTKDDFSCRNRFIQYATLKYIFSKEEWNSCDRILILLTPEAEKANWLDGKLPGLEQVLHNAGFAPGIEAIKGLPLGRNEAEILQLFHTIFDFLQDEDNLYLDLTHAFRYFPALVLVLSSYAKFLKNISVKSITYGNWEMSANGTLPAPIIDLTPLSLLQEWTFAAGEYLNNGYVEELLRLNESEYNNILRDDTAENRTNAIHYKNFVKALQRAVAQRQTCRGLEIIKSNAIHTMIEEAKAFDPGSSLFNPIFKKILTEISSFKPEANIHNIYLAAKWCYKNRLYQQSATLLQEYLITYFCKKFELPVDDKDKRALVNGAFNYASEHLRREFPTNERNYSYEIAEMGKQLLKQSNDLIHRFRELSELRNDLNHAGMRQSPGALPEKRIAERLKEYLDFFTGEDLCPGLHPVAPASIEPVFINLSNHPSAGWEDGQKNAAEQYGRIIDWPFPEVMPNASHQDIEKMADNLVSKIQGQFPCHATIHLMGEMTLGFALVCRFKRLGYRCVASTTARDVIITSTQEKIVRFSFTCFREY